MFTVGELFAGIGGFSLAFHATGMAQTAWFVEKAEFPQKVLRKNFPGVPVHSDIYDCHDLPYVDIITAGFPCQPFSVAGKREGVNDERYLVPEMFRVIREVQPRVVLFENVPGFASVADGDTFKQFLWALAEIRYDAQWGHLAASDVGAPHRRERWFCVAYRQEQGSPSGRFSGWNSTLEFKPYNGNHNRRPLLVNPQQQRAGTGTPPTSRHPQSYEVGDGAADKRERHDQQFGTEFAGMGDPAPAIGQSTSGTRRGQAGLADPGELGHAEINGMERKWAGWGTGACPRPHQIQSEGASDGTGKQRTVVTRLGGDAYGLPARLDGHRWPARPGQPQFDWEPPRVTDRKDDRANRLKALGNAVVPQVVFPLACVIIEYLVEQREYEKASCPTA